MSTSTGIRTTQATRDETAQIEEPDALSTREAWHRRRRRCRRHHRRRLSSCSTACKVLLQGVGKRGSPQFSSCLPVAGGGCVHRISGARLWGETTPGTGPLFLWIPLTCGSALGSPVLATGRAFAGNRSRRNPPRNTQQPSNPAPLAAKPTKRDFLAVMMRVRVPGSHLSPRLEPPFVSDLGCPIEGQSVQCWGTWMSMGRGSTRPPPAFRVSQE